MVYIESSVSTGRIDRVLELYSLHFKGSYDSHERRVWIGDQLSIINDPRCSDVMKEMLINKFEERLIDAGVEIE